jgi:hypothetical protein
MTDETIDLDRHRGMAARKATELRSLLADVETNAPALRLRQDELESHLLAAPAANWPEVAEKARYFPNLFGTMLAAQDPRRHKVCRCHSRGLQAAVKRKLAALPTQTILFTP